MQRNQLMRAILILALAALPMVAMLMAFSPVSAQRPLPPANVQDELPDLGERPAASPAPEASGPAAMITVCASGCDHTTIQAAINAAANGDTISVAAGTYIENIVVNKSVELSGAGAGLTTILPAVSQPNPCNNSSMCGSITAASNIIVIQASGVKIHGFTLDGDNPGLTSGIVRNGADLDARNGIIVDIYTGPYNNLEVYDTTIKNIYLRGIYATTYGSGFNIHDNTIDNVMGDSSSIALFNFGGSGQFANNTVSRANDAISANHSKGTQFLNNTVTASGSGIHTDNAGSGGGAADLIQGNSIGACASNGYGIWVFVPYIAPTVDKNTINDCEVGLSAWGQGAAVTTQFTNNVVDGPASAANSVGVYITTDMISWGYSDVSVSFSGNTITDYGTGLAFTADAQSWNPGTWVAKTIDATFLNNSIAGNTAGADKGTTGTYNLNASGNWWGSNAPATVAATVGSGIDYTPWLDTGTDTSGDPGFQGDFSTLWVDDDSPQTGSIGRIQEGINLVTASTVNVAAGTYDESVNINKSLTLVGAGAGSTTIRGPIGGDSATVRVAANNATIAGFTITRSGNNPVDWNNAGLKSAGIATQGAVTGMTVRDNILTGNRTGIDINNSSGHTIRNNDITFNRTGLLFRNQTDNLTVVENKITDNWTMGILFLDASGGTNSPVQTALNSVFSNNDLSGNWYGQIVDRQSGGSLPAPGTTNLKNFSGNWYGSTAPVVSIANSAEPGYAAQIPVAYGGAATPPGGQPDILGPASANFDFTPYLNSGTDTDVETTLNRGTNGFQGDFSNLWVTAAGAQTGVTARIQEGVDRVTASTVNVVAGVYAESVLLNKSVDLRGAQYGVNVSGRTIGGPAEATVTGIMTVAASNVQIDGFTLTNPNQPYAVQVNSVSSNVTIGHNLIDSVGGPSYTITAHGIALSQGPDSVTIADNAFSNIRADNKSASAVSVLDSVSANSSTGLVIQDNTFSNITSASKGAYGVIINNAAGAPGAQIKDNTFTGLSGAWTHAIGLEGPTPNAVVTGNSFDNLTAASIDKSAVFFEKNPVGGTVTVQCNLFNNTTFYGVAIHPNDLPGGSNGYNYVVTAEDNWWGDASGPYDATTNPSGAGLVGPNVDFEPWLTSNASCASGTGNWLNTRTNAYNDLQDSLDAAQAGDTIRAVGALSLFPGGATVNTAGVIIDLNGKTIGPGSPAFTIVADDVTINGPGVLDGNGAASPGILVQAGADNFILNGVEIREWTDGVHVAGVADDDIESLKIVNNWIHSNAQDAVQVDKRVAGVVTIEGNLFKVNTGVGVSYGGAGTLDATYNSWGDDAGPTGSNGDGVGANVDYDPWTFAEVYLDVDPTTGGDQYVRGVDESASFDVDLNVDGENLYGVSFRFTYDPNYLTFNGPPTFVGPWAGKCWQVGSPPVGTFAYTCYLMSGPAWDGGTVAKFNFTANGPAITGNGPWTTTFDISHLEADTNAGAQGGVKVFVNNAGYNAPSTGDRDITDSNDGRIDITGIAQFTGFVDLQGRPNDSGAVVSVYNQSATSGATLLASGTSVSSGKYTTNYIGPNLLTVGTTYYFQVDRDLYLPTTIRYPSLAANWAQSKVMTARPLTSLATLVLLGGDATNDNTIDINDGTCIGNAYGNPPAVCNVTGSSDVNGDGTTSILDLVLFGGNYNASASPWTP